MSSLSKQLAQLQQAEVIERATVLKTKQDQYVQNRLQSLFLTPGAIPGIGAYVVNNLMASGIRTAADCSSLHYRKISSVGSRRVNAILAWQQSCENTARRSMPTALSTVEDSAITAKYSTSTRLKFQSQLSNSQISLTNQQSSIRQRYATARIPFDSQVKLEKRRNMAQNF